MKKECSYIRHVLQSEEGLLTNHLLYMINYFFQPKRTTP